MAKPSKPAKLTYMDLIKGHKAERDKSKGKTGSGGYLESTGGGDPIKKGEDFEVAPDTETAAQMRKANPGTKVRVDQPRDDQGQFTYNSANFKELKYGPSRGTTIPPQLRGMEIAFAKKSGRGAIKYRGTWYDIGKLSFTEFAEKFKQYQKGDWQEELGKARGIQYQEGNKGGYTPESKKINDGRAKSAKADMYVGELTYKGDIIEFESGFEAQQKKWNTDKKQPLYVRDINQKGANVTPWWPGWQEKWKNEGKIYNPRIVVGGANAAAPQGYSNGEVSIPKEYGEGFRERIQPEEGFISRGQQFDTDKLAELKARLGIGKKTEE